MINYVKLDKIKNVMLNENIMIFLNVQKSHILQSNDNQYHSHSTQIHKHTSFTQGLVIIDL